MAHNKYSPTYSSVYIMFTLCLSLTKRSTLEDRDLCLFCLLKSSWHIVGAEKPFMDWISMATISLLNDHTSRLLDPPLTTPAPFQLCPQQSVFSKRRARSSAVGAAHTCTHRLQTHRRLPTALRKRSSPPTWSPWCGLLLLCAPLPPPSPWLQGDCGGRDKQGPCLRELPSWEGRCQVQNQLNNKTILDHRLKSQ